MIYLIKTVETYRCDTEEEAKQFVEEAKASNTYFLPINKTEIRENKKTEDTWVRVTLYKSFTDEKDPFQQVSISYEVE